MFHFIIKFRSVRGPLLLLGIYGASLCIAFFSTWLMISGLGLDAPRAFSSFLEQSMGSVTAITESLIIATPLLFGSIALSIAFTAKFYNIGAEGQLRMGAIFSAGLALILGHIPSFLLLPSLLFFGFFGGAFWGIIPGILKVRFSANEVLTTLMLNFVAIFLIYWLVSVGGPWKNPDSLYAQTQVLDSSASLPIIIPRSRLHLGFLLAMGIAPIAYLIVKRSILGFRLRAIGANINATRYAGIPVSKTLLIAALSSGGIAGLAGTNELLGVEHSLNIDFAPAFYGYLAIVVVWLAKNDVLGCIPTSIFVGVIINGGFAMQRGAQVPTVVSTYFIGVILVSVIVLQTIVSRFTAKTDDSTPGVDQSK